MFKEEITKFFHYTFEQRGHVIFWIILSVLVFSSPYLFRYFLPPEEIELSNFDDEIAKLQEIVAEKDETTALTYNYPKNTFPKKKKAYSANKTKQQLTPFPFDPNIASDSDFERMGLSSKRIKTILNYRSKGGRFFKKEDLKKIYGLSQTEYQQLESFIEIEKSAKIKKPTVEKTLPSKIPPPPKPIVRVDVNNATVEDWQKLKGIGPYYAKKIVNFRDKLGGFSSIEQIGDTYGLKDSTFQVVKPFLDLSPIIRKIKINEMAAEEIKNHPYIKWSQANVVVKYRKQHGVLNSVEDLKKVGVFSEDDLLKIQPYVEF